MPRSKANSQHGFALVISLSLMAFVLLLILSITILSRVNTQRAQKDNQIISARMNAFLGLQVAMGELQRYAGADQRVTAPIFIEDASTTDLQESGLTQPMWTGVWSSTAAPTDTSWPHYLVSGTAPAPSSIVDPANAINLVAAGSLGTLLTDDKRIVTVEKMDISENSGSYAWWVGDEGAKASLHTKVAESTDAWLHPHQFAPQATNSIMQALYTVSENGNSILSKLNTREQSHIASEDTGLAVQAKFHDYTIHSANLLTDVSNGGFKKNLTAALQAANTADETEFLKLLNDPLNLGGSQIFPPQITGVATASPAEPDPGGPNWRQLASFFQTRVSNSSFASIAIRPQENDQTGIYPVLQSAQMYVYAALVRSESEPDRGYIRLMQMPIITLWNPYNVRLEFNHGRVDWVTGTTGNFPVFQVQYQQGGSMQTDTTDNGWTPEWSAFMKPILKLPNMILEPGETKTFSVEAHQEFSNQTNLLSEGIHYGYGFYRDWSENWPAETIPLTGDDGSPTQIQIAFDRAPQYGLWSLWSDDSSTLSVTAPAGERLQEILFPYNITLGQDDNRWTSFYTPQIIDHDTTVAMDVSGDFPAFGYKTSLLFPNSSISSDHSSYASLDRFPWLVHSNPRASYLGGPKQMNTSKHPSWKNMTARTASLQNLADAKTHYTMNYDDGMGNFYTGYSDYLGVTEQILFDLPRDDTPLLSIGEFSQAPLSEVDTIAVYNDYRTNVSGIPSTGSKRVYSWSPSYIIGNSWADLRIPPEDTHYIMDTGSSGNAGKAAYDLSWLLNDALWDHYFLTGQEISNNNYNRIRPLQSIADTDTRLDSYDESGPIMQQAGAFNINSTSIAAWEALIASTWNLEVLGIADNTDRAPMIRNWYANGDDPGSGGGSPSDPASNLGYRRLTQDEIIELAEAIVVQVKARGPFRSLAEFVNRNPDASAPEHQRIGALQAAIDSTSINSNLQQATDLVSPSDLSTSSSANLYADLGHPEAFTGSVYAAIPGYLTQADVLSRIGHALTARSDTFVIRAYGESLEKTSNNIQSRAWLEATVQRQPERISGTIQDTGNGDNNDMGRRFKIVSLRWLNEDEI
ncbi:hypothetical protein SH580_01075 [Coraliomargarita algicola]|uniref:Type 4 fimbrial biogenesis protein PilX N-terminal domain-containing protein n=1 Tax=Coraliomargarita algicola TaxID=3092156 RepID=A0ABZ0RMG4_9BACT|nr:hypothetical protein [Coraliomargarita sp. J2-16]WPJ96293.1 hypothetical protein SH580_01075 [Coraliomargarita sp. J2-16]